MSCARTGAFANIVLDARQDAGAFIQHHRQKNWIEPASWCARSAARAHLGLYPIVTLQYSSTTLYQVSYHINHSEAKPDFNTKMPMAKFRFWTHHNFVNILVSSLIFSIDCRE
jgi:hypothetical protein